MVGRQAGELERADHAPDVQRRGVGEDVALGERPRLGVAVAHAGDAVVEQPAVGLQQVAQAQGVRVDLDVADVLDHADRGDRVEALARAARASPGRGCRRGRRRRPPRRARGRARPAAPDSVMPVTWTPWLTAACTAKLPQPQPTSSRRSPALQAELACTRARAWSPGPPRASWPRARRSRSCRSSTRRGRARRTPPAGRSGGAPSAGRARSSAGAPAGRARTAGRAGGRSRPIARAAASARRRLGRRGPAPAASRSAGGSIVASMSSTSSSPDT